MGQDLLRRSPTVPGAERAALLDGATKVPLQSVCPQTTVDHSGLPTNPVVTTLVLRVIAVAPPSPPTPADC